MQSDDDILAGMAQFEKNAKINRCAIQESFIEVSRMQSHIVITKKQVYDSLFTSVVTSNILRSNNTREDRMLAVVRFKRGEHNIEFSDIK